MPDLYNSVRRIEDKEKSAAYYYLLCPLFLTTASPNCNLPPLILQADEI
jgi:hypothetical protein